MNLTRSSNNQYVSKTIVNLWQTKKHSSTRSMKYVKRHPTWQSDVCVFFSDSQSRYRIRASWIRKREKRFRSLIIDTQKSYQASSKRPKRHAKKKYSYLFDSGWLRCYRRQWWRYCIVARRFARSNISWFRYWSLPVDRIFIYQIFSAIVCFVSNRYAWPCALSATVDDS